MGVSMGTRWLIGPPAKRARANTHICLLVFGAPADLLPVMRESGLLVSGTGNASLVPNTDGLHASVKFEGAEGDHIRVRFWADEACIEGEQAHHG